MLLPPGRPSLPQLTYTLYYKQVLFKRKPVQFLPPAEVEDDDTEVC